MPMPAQASGRRSKRRQDQCDALSGDAKDKCVKDAKLKYHQ
jgi:hypothetical protein